jgi:hypothetical protein
MRNQSQQACQSEDSDHPNHTIRIRAIGDKEKEKA